MRLTILLVVCVFVCGDQVHETLTGLYGNFTSPKYPKPYDDNLELEWTIEVRRGYRIGLKFTVFDLEYSYEIGLGPCVYDYVLISERRKELKRFCGHYSRSHHNAPYPDQEIYSKGNALSVMFITDDLNQGISPRGFAAHYKEDDIDECALMKHKEEHDKLMTCSHYCNNVPGSYYCSCRAEFVLDSDEHTCVDIRCPNEINHPSNGRITSTNSKDHYAFEDVVTYRCERGYDLIGSSRLECLSNGKWDYQEPTCKIKSCGTPEELLAVKYSSIVDYETKNFTYLEVLTVKCDEWYELTEGANKWRCEDSKQWVRHDNVPNRKMPVCRPKCGIKGPGDRSLIRGLIAGGLKARKHEWPWMVFLNFGKNKYLEAHHYICGGSIISPNYVLTVARCVKSMDYKSGIRWANRTHVWLGVHDRNAKPATVKYVETEHIVMHPKYNKASLFEYDVALIRLRETIIMNKQFRPVCLPSADEDYDMVQHNASGRVAGWGLYNVGFDPSNTLMHAKFQIVDRDTCWNAFQSRSLETDTELPKNFKITKNMFCAVNLRGSRSTCEGDSGVPFVMSKSDPSGTSAYYQVGLVSFGLASSCGRLISYTGYTKLNKEIVAWIMENTNNLE